MSDPHNPIDGDPDTVDTYSVYYRGIAQSVRETIANLNTAVSTADTVSDAVTAFADAAKEVADSLAEVDDRYDVVGEQLGRYATELRRLRDEAQSVVSLRDGAQSDADSLAHQAWYKEQQLNAMDPKDPSYVQEAHELSALRAAQSQAESVALAYAGQIDALVQERADVALACAAAIRDVLDGSPLNDSAWDKFLDWSDTVLDEYLPIIETMLDVVAVVLTIAAFLAVLTGVGAALAPALFAIARAAQFLSKVLKVVKVVLTTTLVVAGKKPVTALADIAVDMAVDRIGGKLVDSGIATVGPRTGGLTDAVLAHLPARGTAIRHPAQIRAEGFDAWVDGTFSDAVRLECFAKLDSIEDRLDLALDVFPSLRTAERLDAGLSLTDWYRSADLPLDGLVWESVWAANDFSREVFGAGPLHTAGELIPDLPLAEARPSVSEVMAAR